MNKQKKNIVLAVIGIIIVAIALILFGIYRNNVPTEEDFLRAIDDAWNNASDPDDPDYLLAIERVSMYEIINIESGDYYTIHVEVTGIDIGHELNQINPNDYPQDETAINAYLIELVKKCPKVETKCTIYATVVDDVIQITFSDTFVDAMTGKIYSYYMEKVNEIMGGAQ